VPRKRSLATNNEELSLLMRRPPEPPSRAMESVSQVAVAPEPLKSPMPREADDGSVGEVEVRPVPMTSVMVWRVICSAVVSLTETLPMPPSRPMMSESLAVTEPEEIVREPLPRVTTPLWRWEESPTTTSSAVSVLAE